MGKSKSRNRSEERESIGSLTAPRSVVRQPLQLSPILSQIQDLRTVADPLQAALDVFGQVAPIGVTDQPVKPSRSPRRSPKLRFDAPASVLVCIRRHTRKEVLFAKGKTGKGSRSPKRLNAYSKVRCK